MADWLKKYGSVVNANSQNPAVIETQDEAGNWLAKYGDLVEVTESVKSEDYDMGTEKDLLDFIGMKEASGNYNAYYGNDKNNEVKFTEMTLDDVINWQNKFVRDGSPSSAVGKYQFIRKTLADLKRTEKLTGEELFTEDLQDTLATALLRRRGLDKFKAGRISQEQFANNLAKEWASLPVVDGPKRGRSYYAGDGLNKALVDVEPFLNTVASIE